MGITLGTTMVNMTIMEQALGEETIISNLESLLLKTIVMLT
jgi:hypothetical protein